MWLQITENATRVDLVDLNDDGSLLVHITEKFIGKM